VPIHSSFCLHQTLFVVCASTFLLARSNHLAPAGLPRSRGGAETRRKKSEGDDVEGGGRRSDSPVRPALPKRHSIYCHPEAAGAAATNDGACSDQHPAAEDAEGPPTYVRGRVVDGCRAPRMRTQSRMQSIAALEDDHLPVPSEHFDTLVVAV
jgi:hypothetical protein